ncbi:hypothetical protein [Prochlorococcus marinus]|uniref:Phage integrase family n=1 Tax=Prochlorococcus marinus str. PAC1 TaxID=59924 RepID=A0A0A2C6Q9_PROMR|nr:hypothetical protein [Prochlorococcus marinus]KGG20339.1 hypothetical protein EV03_1301 [Prochlorococcus marinus str. PAC1]
MPKNLPEKWIQGEAKSLNVYSDLGLKDCPVPYLTIYKNKAAKTKNLFCRWLPPEEEDIRDFKGKKRTPYYQSTGFDDPFLAGKEAINWVKEIRNGIEEEKRKKRFNASHSLHHYWSEYFPKLQRECETKRGGTKKINDTRLKWEGGNYGLSLQDWSKKRIDDIDYKDLTDYWELLDERGKIINSDMAETKRQQKTLLNKLFEEARRSDFPSLPEFYFPKIISGSKDSVDWLTKNEWHKLISYVIEKSSNVADKGISRDQYLNLKWNKNNRKNPRNYVDFYDALMTQWFFYTRAEDMPRLRIEWFREGSYETKTGQKEPQAILYMGEVKGHRPKDDSFSYRRNSLKWFRNFQKRKEKRGWCWFDFYDRPPNNPADSQVLETLNFLLQESLKDLRVKKKKRMTWTNIRHTAFALTVDELPELRQRDSLNDFASNGFTTLKMFDSTYLKKLDVERRARESRQKLARKRSVVKK